MPEANEMVVGIMAVIAQGERKMISERAKAALAAAKARGARLGNPNGAAHLQALGNAKAVEAIKTNAQRRASDMIMAIEDIRADGVKSARQIAKMLNRRGILTPKNRKWHPASVVRVIERVNRGDAFEGQRRRGLLRSSWKGRILTHHENEAL